jgi:hypothetical protein
MKINLDVSCKDCKYNRADWISRTFELDPKSWECEQGITEGKIDVVTGKKLPNIYRSCSYMRGGPQCGADGRLWSPRNTKKFLFKLIRKS